MGRRDQQTTNKAHELIYNKLEKNMNAAIDRLYIDFWRPGLGLVVFLKHVFVFPLAVALNMVCLIREVLGGRPMPNSCWDFDRLSIESF